MTLRHIAVYLAVAAVGLTLAVVHSERAQADATAQSTEVRLDQQRSLSARLRAQLVKSRRAERRWRKQREPTAEQVIDTAAHAYGVSASLMRRIAWCESRFDKRAKNRSSSASGLFQFLDTTWANTPEGKAGLSVWNPFANALAAARHMSRYGTGAWECA